jgi:hypothetical protein
MQFQYSYKHQAIQRVRLIYVAAVIKLLQVLVKYQDQ